MEEIKFNKEGLVPVVTQDFKSGAVLMQAYMNKEALEKTIETGKATYFSRSRNSLWVKGETSGNFQNVIEILSDCDNDSILLKVEQIGVACHTGSYSCFFNQIKKNQASGSAEILFELERMVEERKNHPAPGSYTNYLLDKGVEKTAKKVGEEACEIVIASMKNNKDEVVYETADFLYHLTVLLNEQNVSFSEVFAELEKRH